MSDAPQQEKDLKAGHAPAVKAGGQRITQRKHEKPAEMTPEEVEEFGSPEAPKPDLHKQELVIAGAKVKGDREFQAEAVKAYHTTAQPTREKPHNAPAAKIHQPTKQ